MLVEYSHDFLDESFYSALIVAFSVPFLAVVVIYVAVKTRPLSEKTKTLDKINQYVRENLMGLRVIRAFAQKISKKTFRRENTPLKIPESLV